MGWQYAGASSGSRPADDTGAYKAELCAATVASKLAFDIVKIQTQAHQTHPEVHFVFGSLTVGRQMEGVWSAHCATEHNHFNRALLKLTEVSFQIKHYFHFAPGHADDPGNEIADVLANMAAQGHQLHDWDDFFQFALQRNFVQAVEWSWLLRDPTWSTVLQDAHLQLPAKPTTVPTAAEMMLPGQIQHCAAAGIITMTVATANVRERK